MSISPRKALNPGYTKNEITELILGLLRKIIKIDDYSTYLLTPFSTGLSFHGITKVNIGKIPRNSEITGLVYGDKVKIHLSDDIPDMDFYEVYPNRLDDNNESEEEEEYEEKEDEYESESNEEEDDSEAEEEENDIISETFRVIVPDPILVFENKEKL